LSLGFVEGLATKKLGIVLEPVTMLVMVLAPHHRRRLRHLQAVK
jgi:hypothetical protein